MICSKCGHDSAEKAHNLDPWCMYQVKDGVVVNAMFLPDRIPKGWYDSPKAAKAACEPKVTIYSAEAVLVEPKEINIKVDGRTKEGKKLKAQQDDDSTGSD